MVIRILVLFNICHLSLFAQITFSEVMFDVATSESHDEYVELFNQSFVDSVSVAGWQFSDSSGTDQLLPYRNGLKIGPRRFALILDGSYPENSTTYDGVVPDSVVVLITADNSLGRNGLSNSSAETLFLFDSAGTEVTRYRYSTDNPPGISDEKIIPDGPDDAHNWQNSIINGGTPGRRNSVSPLNRDIGFKPGTFDLPRHIFSSETIIVGLTVYNFGTLDWETPFDLRIYIEKDRNNIPDPGETEIGVVHIPDIAKDDSVGVEIPWKVEGDNHINLVAYLQNVSDEQPLNDTIARTITVLNRSEAIHINEIKFLTAAGEEDWLELYNSSDDPVFLKGWSVGDNVDTVKIDSAVYLGPGQYKVVSGARLPNIYAVSDTIQLIVNGFPALNNQSDFISLFDPQGIAREYVAYRATWLDPEADRLPSLERINHLLAPEKAGNWGPSASTLAATPGEKNSIFSKLNSTFKSKLIAQPDPFSPDGDGMDDHTVISGTVPGLSARLKIRIFDIRGRLVRTLAENRFSGKQFHFIWDGLSNAGRRARIGIYIVHLLAIQDSDGRVIEKKTTVVLAGKL